MWGLSLVLHAQRSFSEDPPVFFNQAVTTIKAVGTEASRKVAFDFQNAWNAKFTTANKEKIIAIAAQMQRKGYTIDPDFFYYFSYLAYSVTQADLNSNDLTSLLEINDQVVKTMEKREYKNFLLGLNIFMARKLLVRQKNLTTITDGGTFSFKVLEEYAALPEEEEVVEELAEETYVEPVEEEPAVDPWSDDTANDPWAQDQDDPWGSANDDPWGDTSNDDWGDSGDSWGDDTSSSDPWGATPTTETAYEDPKPERQVIQGYAENYVRELELQYLHPSISGPIIDLVNTSMLIITPYDSFKIKETTGTFLLNNRTYAGTAAKINWPKRYKNALGAEVSLEEFHIKPDHADFWTPNAKLSFSGLFSGSVDGYFEFKSPRRRSRRIPTKYPIFISNESNVKFDMPGNKMKYTGGIALAGNGMFGMSVSRKKGTFEVLDGRGNKVVVRAEKFVFKDSTVSTENGEFVLYHGEDSIHHASVSVRYDAEAHKLIALRTKKFDTQPFASTYFNVNVNAQLLTWDMNVDSLNMSIMNGKDLIPVTIESDMYYNDIRFRKLASGFNFHPIGTPVYYAKKYGITEFNVDELVSEFSKQDMTKGHASAALKTLAQYGFGHYEISTGQVKLYEKAFHYYAASAKRVDYDNLMIPSLEPNKPNVTLSLDSGTMKVLGVSRFYPTTDFKIKAIPEDGKLTILKGRNLKFDGAIEAGDFRYMGKGFIFDYEEFLINMPVIDSIRIELHQIDTTGEGGEEKLALHNEITNTSGTLFLDNPDDKSGLAPSGGYPHFTSDKDAIVYFDGVDVLGGAYDKSVKFLIPPFDEDSLSVDAAISFDGTFNSGGIFPNFEETLKIQSDQSLGFVHQMPSSGYNLYGTQAKTYEKIYLSNDGIRGGGKIDFITSTIYSDDFVYYPDSVAAFGTSGFIGAGEVNGASYPEAVLGPYRMHWLPRVDSMYLQNLYEPFKFYNATAELEGEVNITSTGVFGSGTMNTRGSVSVSNELEFKQYSYSARHAKFEVLSDNPEKPAMAGDDISLNFDLINNTADVHPEKAGVAAISFPYAQMNTSITNAVWDLEDSVVTMTKPANVPIEDSYFYTTRKELDSLVFNAEKAIYDFNTRELNIQGIPYIIVADAEIIPENNETTILENAELQYFNNAQIRIDTINRYHYLHSGNIKIVSRNEFIGNAMYQLISGKDTFDIRFDQFYLDDVFITPKISRRMTVSGGEVLDKEDLLISPGFYYKGKVKMFAHKKALELDGFVKLALEKPTYDSWVKYIKTDSDPNVLIDFNNSFYEDEDPVLAGLHYDLRGTIYSSFVEKRKAPSDEDFFLAKGSLSYDTLDNVYKIEAPDKSTGEAYEGHTMIYSDDTKDVIFEGEANFFSPYAEKVKMRSAVLGSGNMESGEYKLDALLALDIANSSSYLSIISEELVEIVERLGPPLANDISLELLYKLSNITSDEVAKDYEKSSLKDYVPLTDLSDNLNASLVISGVKMNWSQPHKSWYNTTKLGISNIYDTDINAKLDGFLEIKKDDTNNDAFNLFVQAAPGTWFFISYVSNNLSMYSSNTDFNLEVNAKSNYGNAKPGELVLVGGDENETLGFINSFRENYFGIKEPFSLVYPDDFDIQDDENFETIETEEETLDEVEDDGF